MAENHTINVLNIGSQLISIAKFQSAKNGNLILLQHASKEILADPAAEATRVALVQAAIVELVEQLKIKGQVLHYAIPGQSVFVRFAKLPPITGDNLEQLVKFEAQQQVPYPIEEVTWDYHLLPEMNGEREVALVAIKSDALDEFEYLIHQAGVKSDVGVEAAPIALSNAYLHSYRDALGCHLILDIGARSMNLIYADSGRLFIRSIPSGGAALTSAIAKEFSVPFTEAESHKVHNGMVALGGGHTTVMDESTGALATVIRNALTRLVAEIPRTTNYYRSQHGGAAPTRILLGGGAAGLAYCKEFIEEKLKTPVEFFNPLQRVSLSKNVDAELIGQSAHRMGELVGVALSAFGHNPLKISLLPSAIKVEQDAKKRFPLIAAGSACLVAGALAFAGASFKEKAVAAQALENMQKRESEVAQPAAKVNKLMQIEKTSDEILAQLAAAELDRERWVDIVGAIVKTTANENLWIVDFDPIVGYDPSNKEAVVGSSYITSGLSNLEYGKSILNPSQKQSAPASPVKRGRGNATTKQNPSVEKINAIRMTGLYRSQAGAKSVDTFVGQLKSNPLFSFEGPDGKPLEQNQIIREVQNEGQEGEFAIPFTVVIPLKDSIEVTQPSKTQA